MNYSPTDLEALAQQIVSRAVERAVRVQTLKETIAQRIEARRPTPRQEQALFMTKAARLADDTGMSIVEASQAIRDDAQRMQGQPPDSNRAPATHPADSVEGAHALSKAIGALGPKESHDVFTEAQRTATEESRPVHHVLYDLLLGGAK